MQAFDRFIETSRPLCLYEAAEACIDAAWLMADGDLDGLLSLAETTQAHDDLRDWARWKKPELHKNDWNGIQLGLLVAGSIGLERLFASLDENGDGGLTQAEALADVRLDRRSLREILSDRSAVDWESIAQRLGVFAGLVDDGTAD